MRRFLIRTVLPLFFSVLPPLAAVLIAAALPDDARRFYLDHLTNLDGLILILGAFLFVLQMILGLQAMRWRGTSFDERPDPWLTHLAQAAEWFPLLGLLGTVAGILHTSVPLKVRRRRNRSWRCTPPPSRPPAAACSWPSSTFCPPGSC